MNTWGRSNAEWDSLCSEAERFVVERARLSRTTSYTELNAALKQRTGTEAFDFNLDRDRAAMGELLGRIATDNLPEVGALISAIVIYLNSNDAGTGFYALARNKGLLARGASATKREKFWLDQVNTVFAYYRL